MTASDVRRGAPAPLALQAWLVRHLLLLRLLPMLTCLGACAGEPPPPSSAPDASERLPGGATTNTLLLGLNAFKRAATNISREHEAAFFTGNSFFNSSWVQAPASTGARDGLGPLFNARSCSACHFADGRGRPPLDSGDDTAGLLLRVGSGGLDPHGAAAPDAIFGAQLQTSSIPGVPAEGQLGVTATARRGRYADGLAYELVEPSYRIIDPAYDDTQVVALSPRVAPIMIGLGLLEAIPEGRLLELADIEDEDGDGISGKANRVRNAETGEYQLGRFGWKAEQPSVRQQTAAAFIGDLGITSPLFSDQNCTEHELECREAAAGGAPEIEAHLFERVVLYAQLLAVPMRERWDQEGVLRGRKLFGDLGCAGCHVPRHVTGEVELAEVSEQVIWPYTDLLLHDMGEALGDGRPSFEADGREWRTPPLWGLGRVPEVNGHDRLLHDGRARGVAEAVLWHGGEAELARDRFAALERADREALVTFVESL